MSKQAVTKEIRPAAKGRMATRVVATCALLCALSVVFARFTTVMPSAISRFSIEAVPIALAGYFFGPLAGLMVGAVSDTVGCLFSGYGWDPVLTVPLPSPAGSLCRPSAASALPDGEALGLLAGGRNPAAGEGAGQRPVAELLAHLPGLFQEGHRAPHGIPLCGSRPGAGAGYPDYFSPVPYRDLPADGTLAAQSIQTELNIIHGPCPQRRGPIS
ncbi:MAG: ECF transporter S component [Oscillospiraceae bacterium]